MSEQTSSETRASIAASPIAVVGVSALFPGSVDTDGFWRDILAGRDLISEVPPTHWLAEDYYDPDPKAPDKTYAKRGSFLDPVAFDPVAYGIPPTIVPATDTSQLLALIVAQRVLEDAAGGPFDQIDKSRISVILGVTSAQELLATMVGRLQRPVWVKSLREAGLPEDQVEDICQRMADHYIPWQESTFPGLLGNVVAGRIANRFDLGGTNCVTDAACASTFAGISMAINELRLGESDLVISGGVDTLNDVFMYMCFSKTPALSPSGDCRPFSDQADGTLLGEGLGMVALKRLEDAERDGDKIYAVLQGLGSSSDGRAKSVYAPLPEGQAKALDRAYEQAGYSPSTVELVEAHGTGTKAGDAAEFEGLRIAFQGEGTDRNQWCALGSVKSQVGHTKSAAGAAGLFKVVMALQHGVLPPTIKVDRPNPKLEIESSPFYLNTETRPWIRGAAHPRRGSVSSFGFGGSNFHLALEEYRGEHKAPKLRTLPSELVLLSGASGESLAERCGELAADAEREGFLPWLAKSSQAAFETSAAHRLAIVASDGEDLRQKLETAAETITKAPADPFSTPTGIHYATGAREEGKIAFLFPGQGSQYIGMGADLAIAFDPSRAVWDRAADLSFDPEKSLHDLVFPQPVFDADSRTAQEQELTATEWAQPAIGATSASQLVLLEALGLEPECVGGHSYGEITALFCAGVLDRDAMLKVARKRGELMRDASSTPGAMTACAAGIEALEPLLETWRSEQPWGKDLVMANHNSPKQVVLSGTVEAVEGAEKLLKEERIKARRLPVGTAFHSPLVSPSSEPFREFLGGIELGEGRCDVYSNAAAAPYPTDADEVRGRLAEQIASPVRFVEQVEAMYERGVRVFVEVGPNAVLSGLVGKILGKQPHHAIQLDRKGRNGVTSLWQALGQLSIAGFDLDLSSLWQGYRDPDDPRQRPEPQMKLEITGANYGKIYPPIEGASALPAPNPPTRASTSSTGGSPAPSGSSGSQPPVPSSSQAAAGAESARTEAKPPAPAPQRQAESAPAATPQPPAAAPEPVAAPQPVAAPRPVASPASDLPTPQPQPQPQPARAAGFATVDAGLQEKWLRIYQEAQKQTVDAHTSFQQALAQSQTAFLETVQSSFRGLSEWMHGPAPAGTTATPAFAAGPQPMVELSRPAAMAPEVAATPSPVAAPEPRPAAPRPVAPRPAAPEPAAPEPTAPRPTPAEPQSAPRVDLQQLMLDVVAEKTGYPVEMIQLDMDMEADLGIDSIKRVEILAAMQEKAPHLPEVDTHQMAALKTLRQIVDSFGDVPAAAQESESAETVPVAATAPGVDLQQLMLDVVAEKTGYPVEMIQLDMDMEADLGIDSIKRVEILAAMQEKAPHLPEVDTHQMAALKTLRQIVESFGDVPAAAQESESAEPVPAAATAPGVDLQQLMLEIVAEKTGYPVEMIQLDMDMEADLGIDSIKRVEILAAMQEKAPHLPEVDANQMAALKTLRQIVDSMGGAEAAATPTAAAPEAPAPEAAPSSAPGVDLQQLMLEIVAEKTGYPVEMIQLDMDMEADLGIDSIKRVEILAAMQEKAPHLPEVDANQMAALKTLRQIVDSMGSGDGEAEAVAGAAVETAPEPEAASREEMGRFALRLVETPARGLGLAGLAGPGTLWISRDDRGVAEALSERLQSSGIATRVVDLQALEANAQDVEAASGLVFLGGLDANMDPDRAMDVNRNAFLAAKALAGPLSSRGGILVTVQDTGGDFGLGGSSPERAALGALAGLAKTAAQEWPEAAVKAIDLETGERPAVLLAEILCRELLFGGPDREVALPADGRRLTLESYASEVTGDHEVTPSVGPHSVLVATGGARGVTAATLIELARDAAASEGGPALVLLGRTALADEPEACRGLEEDGPLTRALLEIARAAGETPTPKELGARVARLRAAREIRATLAALEAVGSKARYLPVDVRDATALRSALADVRAEWGPITGLVHGAGVVADKLIADKTLEQYERVVGTKVDGLRALLEATAEDPLELICLFSSVTARCGNQGQCDYAMANEILNKMAGVELRRRGGACRVKSLNWGPWEGGMVTPALKSRFEALGVPLISLAAGARMLVDEVQRAAPEEVEVVLGGEPRPTALLAEEDTSSCRLAVVVDQRSHPYLEGHRIEGQVVLPVVLAMEWLCRLAKTHRPDLSLAGLRDVRVLRGVQLEGFYGTGDAFRLLSCQVTNGSGAELSLELQDRDGRPRYRATAEMLPPGMEPHRKLEAPLAGATATWTETVYDGEALFHGSCFQVLAETPQISDEGMSGSLRTTHAMGWQEEPWILDPAALDGGLQLAVLWFKRHLGGASLPLSVGSLNTFPLAAPTETLHAVLRSRPKGEHQTVSDLTFADENGTVVLELSGVEIFRRPNASASDPAAGDPAAGEGAGA